MTRNDIERFRQMLMDEYGTAMTLYPAAVLDLARIEAMTDDDVIREAIRVGLIRG